MSTLLFKQSIGGKGEAQGLPLRRGSQLYDVEPGIRYPNVLSLGLDSDLHTYDRGIYLRVPHLPVTFVVEPYIANRHNIAQGGTGTYTQRQYFVIKRGQPLMASTKREPTIGVFTYTEDGTAKVEDKTYNDPAKWETGGTLVGYKKDNDEKTVAEYDQLPDDEKEGYKPVYEGTEDTNDKIATGGVNKYAEVEKALFGDSAQATYVEVDADLFFFGAATRSEGFIYPSTGGAKRTVFFNELDLEAGVTLPARKENDSLRLVQPIGNTTDVSKTNVKKWANSAVELPVRPTIGFSHTDLNATTSHQFHMYSTGTDVVSPVRKGRLTIPFVNIDKLYDIMVGHGPEDFKFVDRNDGRSGIKVGVFSKQGDLDVQNAYSLLTDNDSGYANLYYNFAAPFLTLRGHPKIHDKVVPDLFGNYTIFGSTAVDTEEPANVDVFGIKEAGVNAEVEAAKAVQADHVVGRILNIYDTPRRYMLDLTINPLWQSRIVDADRSYLNEGYRRVRSADNAGMEPILADFLFMLLGGSSYEWASAMLPQFRGMNQDLAKVIEALVVEGAAGIVEIALDALN